MVSKPPHSDVISAFEDLRRALRDELPSLAETFRPPQPLVDAVQCRPGTQQLRELWAMTSGQSLQAPGAIGGLQLLGPVDSERERRKWLDLGAKGAGADAVVHPQWDASRSRHPRAVQAVHYAMGWLPLFKEPMEANYLAIDTVPLADGRAGQVVLCGRDEDVKCVVAPDLAELLCRLARDCRGGNWELRMQQGQSEGFRYVHRRRGRLLSACLTGEFG